ncbi:MAG: His/Gly/Thr/Pro-type tRNA ligase C-terminal domain-containing protein, partial [Pseudomonadota bacterium]
RGLRVETDTRNEKFNFKVREHSTAAVPIIIAVGRQEVEGRSVALRRLGQQGQKMLELEAALDHIAGEATPPDLVA